MSKTAWLDGQAFEIREGETILNFVERQRETGAIPTLCYDSRMEPFGSCRVCMVDVAMKEDGPRRTVASCHTPVSEGMHIFPDSDRVERLRRNIIELVLTDYPKDMINGSPNGDRELYDVVQRVGLKQVRYAEGENHKQREPDTSHPYMQANLAACINCYRCVRACDEIQGEFVLNMKGRGFDNRIIMGAEKSFQDSPCVSCGACAQTCPTGAITDINHSMSVAADREVRTVCSYCGVGCNLNVKVKDENIIAITAPPEADVNQGHTCLKGRYAFRFQSHPDRLTSPMIKRNGQLEEVGWDKVYDYMAGKFHSIRNEHGPDAIAGISSARCTNEENYLMQKFIRAVIGTNNIDCCARVCHSPTALGMQWSFGTGAATNSVHDLAKATLFLIIGANPTSAHPVTGAKIKQQVMKGVPLIVVDPIRTEMAKLAKYHLALRPGTNVALLNMFAHFIIEAGLVDEEFVNSRCEAYPEFAESIRQLDIDEMERACGVDRGLVKDAAIAYATAERAMEFHGLGVTEHTQGTKTVTLIADIAMMTGNLGREGVGVNPLRGQNNVQGAADMGAQPHQGAGYLDVTKQGSADHYRENYGVSVPTHIGYKIPQMFNAALENKLKALWIMGEDVVQTDPNTQHVMDALNKLDMLVVQEIFMTETAKLADVILPGTTFLEKNGTFTNAERRIQRVVEVVPPLEGTKTDGQIVVDMMNRMGYEQKGYDADITLQEISKVVPFFAGVKWDELGMDGKQWPVREDGDDTKILHQGEFKRGKGKFHYFDWQETRELVNHGDEYPFILTTGRELEHYNCGTMTRRTSNVDLLTEDILLINPRDAHKKKIQTGDRVTLTSARGRVELNARVTDKVKSRVLYTTFHFPEMMINFLTSNETCSDSLCPEYKVVAVNVEKAPVQKPTNGRQVNGKAVKVQAAVQPSTATSS